MKEFFNINKVVSILVVAFVITFSLCFYFLYDKYDLFRFPFNAEVWGTASDWLMVFVTIATAYYLIKSFKEQKETTRIQQESLIEQQKITRIEQEMYRLNSMPNILCKFDKHESSINLTVTNRDLINCSISFKRHSSRVIRYHVFADDNKYRTFVVDTLLPFKVELGPVNNDLILFEIILNFFDELDNKYEIQVGLISNLTLSKRGPIKISN